MKQYLYDPGMLSAFAATLSNSAGSSSNSAQYGISVNSATLASLRHDTQCPRLYTGTYYGTDSQVDKGCAGHPFKRLHTDSETKNIYQTYCLTCCWETKYGQFKTA
jgi:hypothetical protein